VNEGGGFTQLCLPAFACVALSRDLPRAANPAAALAIVEQVRQQLLGEGLLTVNLDVTPADAPPGVIELQRAWSSRPEQYPVAGRKRKTVTPWTEQLLKRAEVFVGEGDEALAEVFDDSRLIFSMGLHAVVNVPVVRPGGRCFATFNVLSTRAKWTAQELCLIELLAALALPAVSAFSALNS
jgi:GAF domain-containing protein